MGSAAQHFIAVAVMFAVLATIVISSPNTTVISVLCNTNQYTRGDPFTISLAYVLNDLVENTPSSKGRDYYDISPFPNAFAYGHAACSINLNLTAADCSGCLLAAIAQLNATCGMRIGARAILADCSIRYEQYPFVN